ncbi:proton-conducting transporter transmembrane domain-containing protein, partial [Shewanella sp. ECSMB14101]
MHSSTLVTAGLYIFFRLSNILIRVINLNIFINLCLISILISGLKALIEKDIKKVIALSTLRQIGLILFFLLINIKLISFLYICNHALFKSLIFINMGYIIIFNYSNQYIFNINTSNINLFFNFSFKISCFNLINLTFYSSFYLKEILLIN